MRSAAQDLRFSEEGGFPGVSLPPDDLLGGLLSGSFASTSYALPSVLPTSSTAPVSLPSFPPNAAQGRRGPWGSLPSHSSLNESPPSPTGLADSYSQEDLQNLFAPGAGDGNDDMDRHRSKNRAAQKRFRQRQKARMATSAQQVADLTAQLEALTHAQEDLKARNRVLDNIVRLTNRQNAEIALLQEVQSPVQAVILQETTRVYQRALRRPELSQSEVCSAPVGQFMEETFPALLNRERELLEESAWNAASPSGRELAELVLARRAEEGRSALFSHWHHGILAWNKEEMTTIGSPPSATFWDCVMAGVRLQPEQMRAMVLARQRLLKQVSAIRQAREKVVMAFGLAVIQRRPDVGTSTEAQGLRISLEQERESVLEFLHTLVDEVLTPAQEVYLDVQSYPWWPDLWYMSSKLAQDAAAASPNAPSADVAAPLISSNSATGGLFLLPRFSAFEMLQEPLLARGCGLQFKRCLASIAVPQDIMEAAAKPPPPITHLRDLSMLQFMAGTYLCSSEEQPSGAASSSKDSVKSE